MGQALFQAMAHEETIMNKIICALMASAIAGSFAVATIVPVTAAVLYPMHPKSDTANETAIINVRNGGGHNVRRRPGHGHHNRGHGHYNRGHGHYNRGHGHYNRGHGNYYRGHGNYHRGGGYWRGYRGYHNHRPGYRYYNGWWYPAAAFVGGAIVGGAVANEPTYYAQPSYGNAHVQWCYNRYRSYRSSDNTFQPNSGPRRQCVSPYG